MKFKKSLWTSLACLLSALVLSSPIQAREMAQVKAERQGMSAERLQRLTALGEKYVAENKLAGVLTMVARNGKVVYFDAQGNRGLEDARPLTKDALFRIYSMSKPITAVAAMMLYEEGKFQLSDPVAKFVPELAKLDVLTADGELVPAKNTMTMRHLLTHTAGLSYGFDPRDPVDQQYQAAKIFAAKDLDEFAGRIAKLPLKFEPGERWHYSVAVDITGLVVQRLSGQRFDKFLQERIFDPLKMPDTFFEVPADKMDRFLPNHGWDPKQNKMVVFDDSSFSRYTDTTLFSGGGGLVSTASDYMRFAEMVRNGGSLDGVRLLSPKTVQFMTMDHLPASMKASGSGESPTIAGLGSYSGVGFGLGFAVINDVAGTGVMGSAGEHSWGGAAGTIFWIDPVEEIVVVGMIQQMGSPWPLRAELKVLTNQAITELASPDE